MQAVTLFFFFYSSPPPTMYVWREKGRQREISNCIM